MFTEILDTRIEIHAPASTVWQALTNFAQYPRWNPLLRGTQGEPRVGEHLRMHIESPSGRITDMGSVVQQADPNKRLAWMGTIYHPLIFSGLHSFTIERELPDGGVLFAQHEIYTGLSIPFIRRMLQTDTLKGFHLLNEALKVEAERLAAAP